MTGFLFHHRKRTLNQSTRDQFRRLGMEQLEDRRVLSSEAHIIFLFDESESTGTAQSDWLADMVVDLDGSLNLAGVQERRYGLVGFADGQIGLGHTHLVDPNDVNGDGNTFVGTASQVANAATAINTAQGDGEDGWDAIEHGIAEYNFPTGAAVIFVLIQKEGKGVRTIY
jgi:hypothetical protein